MTTILADARLGVMVSDANFSDEDRFWLGRKVFRIRGALIGVAGAVDDWMPVLEWLRKGGNPPKFGTASILMLDASGVRVFNSSPCAEKAQNGREAIGTGAKAAMCAYEALGFTDPRKAVRIVCKYDAGSRGPVRVYKFKEA